MAMEKDTILVVEDEALVGLELKEDLERLGYCVPEVVESGEAVMPAVARYKPDLLLMDVRLPGSPDGIDVAFQVKAEFDVPVIYLTAYSDTETLRRAARTDPDAFLFKPFDERELAANVAIALARAKSGEQRKRELRGAVALIDALDDPALIADEEGRIIHVNAAGIKVLNIADSSALASAQLSRLLVRPGDQDGRGALDLRRIGDGGALSRIASVQRLLRFDGHEYGSLVLFGTMEKRERRLLAESAAEANAILQRGLPGPDSAGQGYRVAGFLDPCPSGSGDFFDAFPVGAGKVGFYGLDVMGHGVVTALMAFSLRDLIPALGRSGSSGGAATPAELLKSLYKRYCRPESFGATFFSIAYGVIDGPSGEYRLARGGYTPVLRIDARGYMRIHRSGGSAVGVADDAEIEESGGVLSPGDRLLVVSNGLLDSFGGGLLEESLRNLGSFAESNRALSLEAFVEAFQRRSRAEAAKRASVDDVSLLVIERAR